MYIDILRRLRDTVRRKHPEKLRTDNWFLPHDNAPAYRPILVKDFFSNEQCNSTGASPILS
jgi:hypothetical protein